MNKDIKIEAYNYNLPNEQIADFPLAQRDQSKLLVYKSGKIENDIFYHLPQHLPQAATLVLNNTKVIEARVFFQKDTGGIIEIFCLEPYQPAEMALAMAQTERIQWRCMIGGASKWKPGLVLHKILKVGDKTIDLQAHYVAKDEDSFIIEFSWNEGLPFAEVLHEAGAIPLPPYIKRKAEEGDANRYQTVFAQHKGSVAAPTAALHFTQNVFEDFSARGISPAYITLHVGAGTFKPVKTETIAEHLMHAENFSVSANFLKTLLDAEHIIAVGTTSLRTLESLHWLGIKLLQNNDTSFELGQWEAYDLQEHDDITYKQSLKALLDYVEKTGQPELWCRTSLLVMPGYKIRSAEALVTNFHQPKSTLLLLVAAFIGEDWKKVYDHALKNNYRFLSYGDSSLLWRK